MATSYNVKRSSAWEGPYEIIASGLTTTSYEETYTGDKTYFYVVTALNSNDESSNSLRVSINIDKFVYLKFDETEGNIAIDSWSGLDGLLDGEADWTEGISANAVYLNGINNSDVALPEGIMSEIKDFTISTWVKLDEMTIWTRIFDFGSSTDTYMFLTPLSEEDTVRFAIKNGDDEQQINGAYALSTGEWHHVAVTLSGTVGILYVEGVEVGRNSNMTLNPSNLGMTTQNWIGKSQWYSTH
ncbi:LamG domain-containing protein [Thalassobellus suaedae]|uniref:LamG domain-containing protein n=1 Tax=Thalassobellus suaedae TaxID=3074124 RepID=A0ABY9XX94_9FLAO|nr:LamG domain-containing protein [Flavobacteriaceae bacterium HL-DH14]